MSCNCIPCPGCGGTGEVWYDYSGDYLGTHRWDDMDELYDCPVCNGAGIIDQCDECRDAYDEWAASLYGAE